jgi:hypothetical protein
MIQHFARMLIAAILILSPADLSAQSRAIELGIDGAISREWASTEGDDPSSTALLLPATGFRIGFLSSNRVWSIEPSLGFVWRTFGGGDTRSLILDVGPLYHFSTDRTKPQLFVHPFVGLLSVNFDSDAADSDVSRTHGRVGLGAGVKIPIVDRLATRLEARYARTLASDNIVATNELAFRFGLSFFTR